MGLREEAHFLLPALGGETDCREVEIEKTALCHKPNLLSLSNGDLTYKSDANVFLTTFGIWCLRYIPKGNWVSNVQSFETESEPQHITLRKSRVIMVTIRRRHDELRRVTRTFVVLQWRNALLLKNTIWNAENMMVNSDPDVDLLTEVEPCVYPIFFTRATSGWNEIEASSCSTQVWHITLNRN